jgi:hypothetical protein
MVGSMVSHMVAKNEGRVGPILNANEALVCLNLPKGAAREAGHVGFKVRPKDVPLALTGYDSALLEVMNASQSSG